MTNLTNLNKAQQLESAQRLWASHQHAINWESTQAGKLQAQRLENLANGIGELSGLNEMIGRHEAQVVKHRKAQELIEKLIQELTQEL